MKTNFKKVHTAKDLTISAILTAAGVGLFFADTGLGILFIACGLLMLLFFTTGYKKDGENVILTKKTLNLGHSCRQSLADFLSGNSDELEIHPQGVNEGIIQMEIYYNAKAHVAYAQVFDYSNYTYVPATDVTELRGAKADKLINKIQQ